MKQLILLFPEIFLSVVSLAILVGEAFYPKKRKTWLHVGFASLLICLIHQVSFFVLGASPWAGGLGVEPLVSKGLWIQYDTIFGMVALDSLAVFFKIILLIAVILVGWISLDYYEFKDTPLGTYASLLLIATVGMLFLVGSVDFLCAIISLEILSISSFVLSGFILSRRSSSEGAIKFLLVGTLSTAIFLLGISYYYGYFGSTRIEPLQQLTAGVDLPLSLILMLLLAGIGFKLAMVPFHMWAPDAYEGSPTPVTAFLSVAPKAAAIGFLLRLIPNPDALGLTPVISVLAALTMTVGNLGALHQTNVKRLLAYSSVAQVGYILVAMVAGGTLGSQAAMVYTFFYVFMNMGIFAGLLIVSSDSHSEELTTFSGLSNKSLLLSLALIMFLLSLTGIPPLAGFVGKFAVFASVIQKPELLWLGIVAVLNSVVSLYYYFRIAQQIFFKESSHSNPPVLSPALVSCLVIALVVTLIGGMFPEQVLGWVRNVVGS
jgi:NADH-quinone oxidoreductase subunit N